MIIIDFIKRKYQERQIRSLLAEPRNKRIDNWEHIKTIGLIFTVGDVQLWNLIHRFVSTQEQTGKEVHLIGFHPADYEIDYIFSHTRTTICHEKDDQTFFGLPKEGVVDSFTERHYDLLIDATEQPDFFGKYVSMLAEANLKVGYTNSEAEYDEGIMDMYDMCIQGNATMDFKDYIEQIVKYLAMVQK